MHPSSPPISTFAEPGKMCSICAWYIMQNDSRFLILSTDNRILSPPHGDPVATRPRAHHLKSDVCARRPRLRVTTYDVLQLRAVCRVRCRRARVGKLLVPVLDVFCRGAFESIKSVRGEGVEPAGGDGQNLGGVEAATAGGLDGLGGCDLGEEREHGGKRESYRC